MDNFKQWAMGTLKSWTAWFGALLIGLPELWPLIQPQIEGLVSPEAYRRLVQVIGLVVIVLRYKTTQGVSAKGAPQGGFIRIRLLLILAALGLLVPMLQGCPSLGLVAPENTADGIVYAKTQVTGLKQLNTSLLARDRISLDRAHENHTKLSGLWDELERASKLIAQGLPRDAAAILASVNGILLELEQGLHKESP